MNIALSQYEIGILFDTLCWTSAAYGANSTGILVQHIADAHDLYLDMCEIGKATDAIDKWTSRQWVVRGDTV
jgi:hypothetical protein